MYTSESESEGSNYDWHDMETEYEEVDTDGEPIGEIEHHPGFLQDGAGIPLDDPGVVDFLDHQGMLNEQGMGDGGERNDEFAPGEIVSLHSVVFAASDERVVVLCAGGGWHL